MYDGILVVWKPRGMTSFDVVYRLRKYLKTRKIGHTGTLDPQVDGILVICVGKATKLVQLLTDSDKTYEGAITLGYSTETEDAHGETVDRVVMGASDVVDSAVIDAAMASFVGTIEQVPPMYSAVKVKGRRLYEYARAGEEVERPIRQAKIYSFERETEPVYDAEEGTQTWRFAVECGKGTYVRTLAVDLGAHLGYPAHMSDLTRTSSGGYTKEHALTLDEIAHLSETGQLAASIQSIESALSDFNSIRLFETDYVKIKNGQVLPDDYFGDVMTEPTALYDDQGVLAIYQPHPTKEHLIKPLMMFS